MSKTRYDELKPLLGPDQKALILIRPDPDSLASGWALAQMFAKHRSKADVAIYEPIKRIENRNMVRLLRIPLIPIKEAQLKSYTRFCMVDGQPNQVPDFIRPEWHVILDHHPVAAGFNIAFADIQPERGATSTIATEYLKDAGIRITERLATALCYGIITDTDYFQRKMTREDALAFSHLFPQVNYQILKVIEQTEIPLRQLESFDQVLHRLKVRNRRAVVHMGAAESADIAVIMADFFIRVSGISFVAFSCIAQDKLIIVFRSHDLRKNAGKIAADRFGELGSAGGHHGAARAEVPLDKLPPEIKLYSPDSFEDFINKRLSRPGKRAK